MGVRSVNNSLQQFLDTFIRSGTDAAVPASAYSSSPGLTATGGVVSDYVSGSTIYRAHIFTSSGTFSVSALGAYGSNVEYLVVAGGGGGGASQGGGGGAGGLRTNVPGVVNAASSPLTGPSFPVTAGPTSYTVTIGGGGNGYPATTSPTPGQASQKGTDSYFGPPSKIGRAHV